MEHNINSVEREHSQSMHNRHNVCTHKHTHVFSHYIFRMDSYCWSDTHAHTHTFLGLTSMHTHTHTSQTRMDSNSNTQKYCIQNTFDLVIWLVYYTHANVPSVEKAYALKVAEEKDEKEQQRQFVRV